MSLSHAQMRAFNAVVREGSVSRAAVTLGLSQPAVTTQVRKLESAYGVQLFERTAEGVTPTALGRRLYALTQQVDDVEQAATALLEAGAHAPQALRIATPSPQVFMPLIAAFKAAYPSVNVSVRLGSTGEAVDLLHDRQVDVGLLHLETHDERFSQLPYRPQRLHALLPRDHPLAARDAVTLAELAAEPMVTRSGPSLTQAMGDRAMGAAGLAPEPVLVLETREAVREAVAAGIGVGFMLHNDRAPDPRLVDRPIRGAGEEAWEAVVWLRARDRLPAIRTFARLAGRLAETETSATPTGGEATILDA